MAEDDLPDPEPGPEPDRPHGHAHHQHPVRDALVEAAIEAEYRTGRHEETEEEARRAVLIRLVRMIAGFTLIGIGLTLLVLPGPGWVVVIVGLSLLPFAWAERTIRLIRRKVPGIPEDGRIPPGTWAVMGLITVGALTVSLLWGGAIGGWVSDTWSELWG